MMTPPKVFNSCLDGIGVGIEQAVDSEALRIVGQVQVEVVGDL